MEGWDSELQEGRSNVQKEKLLLLWTSTNTAINNMQKQNRDSDDLIPIQPAIIWFFPGYANME